MNGGYASVCVCALCPRVVCVCVYVCVRARVCMRKALSFMYAPRDILFASSARSRHV